MGSGAKPRPFDRDRICKALTHPETSSPQDKASPQSVTDLRDYRTALGSFGTGVAIATTCDAQGQPAGLTINSFSSVSLTPPMVLWSLSKTSSKYAAFQSGSHFCINILQKDQLSLAMQFSRHADDKFLNTAWEAGLGGAPKILGALATFECRNTVHYEGGDHTIFLGEVEAYAHHQGEPLLFHRGSFGGFLPS